MVVLAILLAASSPQFAQTAARMRTEQTAFELTQLLRYAHQRAVMQGQRVDLMWDAQTRRAQMTAPSGQAAPPSEAREQRFLSSTPVPSDITVHFPDPVSFFPDGTSQPSTIEISHRSNVYTVQVDAATSQATLSTPPSARD